MKTYGSFAVTAFFILLSACIRPPDPVVPAAPAVFGEVANDVHSYANTAAVRVEHGDFDWIVDFDRRVLRGTATLRIARSGVNDSQLVLDTRELKILGAELSANGAQFAPAQFTLGNPDKILGSALTVPLRADSRYVRISYETSPAASGLQWLTPAQTAGKTHPFMFTQSQAIHARSWIPIQDTPQVRITYSARVRTPRDLVAAMSAENDATAARDGDYQFRMAQPIPAYLIALAVGDLDFRPIGRRTGVYAEPSVVDRAAAEFADTEKMVDAAERLYGPYRWGRYDILVLPPSFPFGGMENPRLTFATPTILAGDRSLVSLIAHELAHSWSGNLVTNATWRDFWLNEGFTVYIERRIQEELYGPARAEMEAVLGRQDLEEDLATLEERDEILHVNLQGRDPDEGFTQVPYEKGALFLRHLEETFGRATFDEFLRGYFDHFAFQSITTDTFLEYLEANLLSRNPQLAARVPVREWIMQPGIPATAPRARSDAFARVEQAADAWLAGSRPASQIDTARWTTHEWLHFLRYLPKELSISKMEDLDRAFRLTQSGNAEIAHEWLLTSIRNQYRPAYARLEDYLISIGRRKLIKPLYEELVKTEEGRQMALAIYRRARSGYHPIAVTTIDEIVKWES